VKIVLKMALLAAVSLVSFGCAHNYYNMPQDVVEKKVRVLGIAPIYTDPDPSLKYPEREALIALIKDYNRKNEKELVALVKKSDAFYSVKLLDDDPDQLYPRLLAKRERRDDASVTYNKYFFKPEELKDYVRKNAADAVLFVVVSGITQRDKVYSKNLLDYLEADYQYLIMTGQMLDADGSTVWEYPNFRRRSPSLPPFLALQYPDFDEAAANLDERVDIKYKTIPGIRRALDVKEKDYLRRSLPVSSLYYSIFDDMASLLKHEKGLFGGKKEEKPAKPAEQADQTPAIKPDK